MSHVCFICAIAYVATIELYGLEHPFSSSVLGSGGSSFIFQQLFGKRTMFTILQCMKLQYFSITFFIVNTPTQACAYNKMNFDLRSLTEVCCIHL